MNTLPTTTGAYDLAPTEPIDIAALLKEMTS
ncbi:hypothetical protein EDF38_0380 [Frigoribacterium sp. PhB160]|jgi:hypothetical protein|nr:hypothetical protein EDF38_0380 [Frigoribacterium sp. PhB160]